MADTIPSMAGEPSAAAENIAACVAEAHRALGYLEQQMSAITRQIPVRDLDEAACALRSAICALGNTAVAAANSAALDVQGGARDDAPAGKPVVAAR